MTAKQNTPQPFDLHAEADKLLDAIKDTEMSGAEIMATFETAKLMVLTDLMGQMIAATTASAMIRAAAEGHPDTAPSSSPPAGTTH